MLNKYFSKFEVWEFIKYFDNYDENLLISAVMNLKDYDIIKLTWEKVK